MIRILTIVTAGAMLIGFTMSSVSADNPGNAVFEAGQDGYKVFRIPAIVQAANGELPAFCEAPAGRRRQ